MIGGNLVPKYPSNMWLIWRHLSQMEGGRPVCSRPSRTIAENLPLLRSVDQGQTPTFILIYRSWATCYCCWGLQSLLKVQCLSVIVTTDIVIWQCDNQLLWHTLIPQQCRNIQIFNPAASAIYKPQLIPVLVRIPRGLGLKKRASIDKALRQRGRSVE